MWGTAGQRAGENTIERGGSGDFRDFRYDNGTMSCRVMQVSGLCRHDVVAFGAIPAEFGAREEKDEQVDR